MVAGTEYTGYDRGGSDPWRASISTSCLHSPFSGLLSGALLGVLLPEVTWNSRPLDPASARAVLAVNARLALVTFTEAFGEAGRVAQCRTGQQADYE